MANKEDIKEIKKELKKLKPRARIKKLRGLEEKRKLEIAQIEYLIKDIELDLKPPVKEEIVPEQQENIGKIVEEESEQLEKTVKEESPIEDIKAPGYAAFKQAYGDYSSLRDISYASMMGPLTPAQMDQMDQIGERLDRTKYKSASEEVADILVASRSTLHKIKKYASLD